jgi:hypothetical protein
MRHGDYPLGSPLMTARMQSEAARLPSRFEVIDNAAELVGSMVYLHPDDLIRILKAGYRNMTTKDRDEFMRRVLLELKKSQR